MQSYELICTVTLQSDNNAEFSEFGYTLVSNLQSVMYRTYIY